MDRRGIELLVLGGIDIGDKRVGRPEIDPDNVP